MKKGAPLWKCYIFSCIIKQNIILKYYISYINKKKMVEKTLELMILTFNLSISR